MGTDVQETVAIGVVRPEVDKPEVGKPEKVHRFCQVLEVQEQRQKFEKKFLPKISSTETSFEYKIDEVGAKVMKAEVDKPEVGIAVLQTDVTTG